MSQMDSWFKYRYQMLQLSPEQLRVPGNLQKETALHRSGRNLTGVFSTLGRRRQIQVAQSLSALVPSISDVEVRPAELQQGALQLRFEDRWQTDLWYTPEQVSDGTMLILAFLVLQYQDPPVDLLCIDDPEHGLHPYLLREVVALLRKMAHGEIGPRPIQVLLATHSAALLDFLEPEEVRFLSRDPKDGSTLIHEAPTNTPDWKSAFEEYQSSMGAMWLSGGLGGVPGV